MCDLQCIVKELQRRELVRLSYELESINARKAEIEKRLAELGYSKRDA
jgi:hypothetical protein